MTKHFTRLCITYALSSSPVAADSVPTELPPDALPVFGVYDVTFCREINGFSEDYVINQAADNEDWLLTDCTDGTSAYIRIVD